MAEGWVKKLFPDKFEVHSAGVNPGKEIDPRAVKAMAEAGADISKGRPKSADEFKGKDFDIVATVCDHACESCPVWLGKAAKIHRGFQDPPFLARDAKTEEDAMAHYRRARDEMCDFVKTLGEKEHE